jgi:biotin carboxyl carrier protein
MDEAGEFDRIDPRETSVDHEGVYRHSHPVLIAQGLQKARLETRHARSSASCCAPSHPVGPAMASIHPPHRARIVTIYYFHTRHHQSVGLTRPGPGRAYRRRTPAWPLSQPRSSRRLQAETAPAPKVERPVQVQRVTFETNAASREFVGIVRARYETDLGFRVGGKIVARLVNVGDRVRAGDVIARLDPHDLTLQVESAEADLPRRRTCRKRRATCSATRR